jgi:NAD(P)H-hydrate epimerase
MIAGSHPVLTCDEARSLEAGLFDGDEAAEWSAMHRAGAAIADEVLRDFEEIGSFPADGRVLVLVGKGHNGGDALIAAQRLAERFPGARAEVVFAFGERMLRPLATRAWRELAHSVGPRVAAHATFSLVEPGVPAGLEQPSSVGLRDHYDLCLDGIFGFQFRPPVDSRIARLLAQVNALPIRLRAAVDLPSGLGEKTTAADPIFRADFTYATGSVKTPVIEGANAAHVGRLRYLDLGFFTRESSRSGPQVLTSQVLAPLRALRSAESDKRSYGHVMILGGSRDYPGAVLMTVLAALRSGAGLVTAFVPESLAPAFAARAPEAMWVGWPETPDGGLALEGQHLLQTRLERANALVIGPGLGREPETLALVKDVVSTSPVPLVLDADALQWDIVRAGTAPRVLTPHLGELRRVLEGDDFYQTRTGQEAVLVVKGRLTCLTAESGRQGYYSPFGGPVLARGGSGDLLAGMAGAQLAREVAARADAATSVEALLRAAAQAVVWHGYAADLLARTHGQVAVTTTQLLDFLPAALRQ